MNKGLKIRLIPKFTISVLILLVLVTGTTYSILDLDLKYGYAQGNGGKQDLFFISSQDSQCPQNLAEGPSFIDENGCSQPCPTDPEVIPPEVCIPPIEQDQPQDDQPPAAVVEDDQPPAAVVEDDQPQDDQPPAAVVEDDQPQDDQPPAAAELAQGNQTPPNNLMANTISPDINIDYGRNGSLLFCDPKDLTGKWKSNDGGSYYIRQIGDTVWWAGAGPNFVNVFHGYLSGGGFYGHWQDVPLGKTNGAGDLTLSLEPLGSKFTKTKSGGNGFGGSEWTKVGCIPDVQK
jgi:hypothetical protein